MLCCRKRYLSSMFCVCCLHKLICGYSFISYVFQQERVHVPTQLQIKRSDIFRPLQNTHVHKYALRAYITSLRSSEYSLSLILLMLSLRLNSSQVQAALWQHTQRRRLTVNTEWAQALNINSICKCNLNNHPQILGWNLLVGTYQPRPESSTRPWGIQISGFMHACVRGSRALTWL